MDTSRRNESFTFDASTCRCCLRTADDAEPIFRPGSSLADHILECTEVRISINDDLPKSLCKSCRSDLNVAHLFRVRCRQSDALLRHFANERGQVEVKPIVKNNSSLSSPTTSAVEDVNKIKVEINIKNEKEDFDEVVEADKEEKEKSHDRVGADEKKIKNEPEANRFTERKQYTCTVCRKPFAYLRAFERHAAKCEGRPLERVARPHACTECPYASARRQALAYHMRTHTGERPYACDVCGARFAQPGVLRDHLRRHGDAKEFVCDECGKQFKVRSQYRRHRRVHSTARAYVCDVCDKGLKSKDALTDHLNRHYDVRNYACDACGALFVTDRERRAHRGTHATEKSFACHVCDFKTRTKLGLRKHVECHAARRVGVLEREKGDEKLYSCTICDAKFERRRKVVKHMSVEHNAKYPKLWMVSRIQ